MPAQSMDSEHTLSYMRSRNSDASLDPSEGNYQEEISNESGQVSDLPSADELTNRSESTTA